MDAKMKKKQETSHDRAGFEAEPVETKWIPIDEIEPHPDALAFWGGDDEDEQPDENTESGQDSGALQSSVARQGNLQAALVTRKEDGRGWWLLDGCGRLAGAVKGGRSDLYCTVVDIAPADFRKLMMEVNMNRHRVATPSRVLRYLELYQEQVLAAAQENADPEKTGAKGGRGIKGVPAGTAFSVDAIRERLHCRKQEVVGGIMLLKCRRYGAVPYKDAKGKWQLRPASEDELQKRDKIVARIRKGAERANLTRWAQGFIGAAATKDKPRAATNYLACALRGIAGLTTAFGGWNEIALEDRQTVLDRFDELMRQAPDDVLHLLQKLLPPADGKKR